MILMLHAHHSRSAELLRADRLITHPHVPQDVYADSFGNTAPRIVVPAGGIPHHGRRLDPRHGLPDPFYPHAQGASGPRCCPRCIGVPAGKPSLRDGALMDEAWRLFGHLELDGSGCRPCATSCTGTSPSAILRAADQDGLGGVQ